MGKRHAAIWIVVFAILANTANGSVVSPSDCALATATICDAQSLINDLSESSQAVPAAQSVCHLQYALGAASGEDLPEPILGSDVLHAVVEFQRYSFTVQAQRGLAAVHRAIISLHQDIPVLPAPRLHVWTPPGRASGNRYLYLLSPHAPPLDA